MSSTLLLPGDELPINDTDEMQRRLKGDVDLIIAGGSCGVEPTTVLDLTGDYPVVLREGKGVTADFA
jgi:tRNA A37 threonylcarbamoyladenosine synthetase subunit TsaC/SUA5/YrdC